MDPERRDLIRRKARRDALVASVSLILFVTVAVVLIARSPGWPTVQDLFFNGEAFKKSFPAVLSAFWLNVRIFLVAEPCILILALIVALTRGSTAPILFPLRAVATLYTDIFRGIPTILLVLLLGFGVPALNSDFIGLKAQDLNLVTAVLVAVALVIPQLKRKFAKRKPS